MNISQISRHASRSIAGDLSFAAISVDQANGCIQFSTGQEPFHPVGAYSVVTIAKPPRQLVYVRGCVFSVNNEEIVAAGRCLDERNFHWQAHSVSLSGIASKLWRSGDRRSASIISLCSRCVPSTLNMSLRLPFSVLRCMLRISLPCSSMNSFTAPTRSSDVLSDTTQ